MMIVDHTALWLIEGADYALPLSHVRKEGKTAGPVTKAQLATDTNASPDGQPLAENGVLGAVNDLSIRKVEGSTLEVWAANINRRYQKYQQGK
jgi:protocatechuate 3,4-dioxygenase beta subunit